jgi:hypothetical protein
MLRARRPGRHRRGTRLEQLGALEQDLIRDMNEEFGGRLSIENLMIIQLLDAVLAFLSACKMTRGSQHLPDQTVHLEALMLLCDFRGVVGTMW